ncbi:unnamed protein product, partial [Prorocentrum cordatum]
PSGSVSLHRCVHTCPAIAIAAYRVDFTCAHSCICRHISMNAGTRDRARCVTSKCRSAAQQLRLNRKLVFKSFPSLCGQSLPPAPALCGSSGCPAMALEVGETDWVVVGSIMLFQWVLEFVVLTRMLKLQVVITLDVLDNMSSVNTCKESVRNIFTNLAIVAALIMTIAFAMLFLYDHVGNIADNDDGQRLTAHAFIAFTGYACIQSMRAMVESVLNIVYTEMLTSPEIVRFLIAGSGAIGAPVIATVFSVVSILCASTLYILSIYSVAASVLFGCLSLSRLISIGQFWRKRSKFTTNRSSKHSSNWSWAEDLEAAPPSSIAKKCSENEIAIMRRHARQAKEEEEASVKVAAVAAQPPEQPNFSV